MINKTFRKNKKFKSVIALTLISSILTACGSKAVTSDVTTSEIEASITTSTTDTPNLEAGDKSLADLFLNHSSDDDEADDEQDDKYDDDNDNNGESDFESDSYNNSSEEYSFSLDDDFENDDTNTYTHTVMVYMVGSDLESNYGSASADLAEMFAAKPDLENNNVVVFTGGASQWQIPSIDADKSYLLELKEDDFYPKEEFDACNMGESASLSNFVTYCLDEYDTDKYSLILWNHGAGPVMGFGVDENYSDILSLPELQKALDTSVGKSDKKLELIGFDACLMSSLEVADAFAPYANYLVSSQETEPGWGWNYAFLSELSEPGMNGAGLGKEIIDSYMDYSEEMFERYPKSQADITLSCIDLTKYDDVEKSLGEFFTEVDGNLSVTTFPEVIRERNEMRNFGSFSSDYNYSLIDTVDLVEQLCDNDNENSAQKAVEALDEMMVYNQTNMFNANGVSICFPYNTEAKYEEAYLKVNEYLNFSPEYTRFLNNVYALQNGETIVTDWNISDAETNVENTEVTEANITSDGSDISLQLTNEQQKNFAGANFYILANAKELGFIDESDDSRAEDLYFYVYCGKNVQMDEAGRLHAYYDNNILYVKGTSTEDKGELSKIPMILVDADISNTKEKRYTTAVVLQNTDPSDISSWKFENAKLQIVRDEKHPNGYVRSAIPLSDADSDIHTPSKQLLDSGDYTTMSVTSASARYITKDENGRTLPFWKWDDSDMMLGFDVDITNGIEFESTSIPDPENYMCMFAIYDSQGNITSSELIPLK